MQDINSDEALVKAKSEYDSLREENQRLDIYIED